MIHYPVAPHMQAAFAYMKFNKGDFPIMELIQSEILSLPIFP